MIAEGAKLCGPCALALAVGLLVNSAAHAKPRAPRVAVFELELRNVTLKSSMAKILRDYLSDRLAATGRYRVVPGDKTRSALNREQIRSRGKCFAKSCHIRVGVALAADRSLSTRVMRIGRKCTVSSMLYDLKTQVTEKGATHEGGCREQDVKASIDVVVRKLTGANGGNVEPEGPSPGPVSSGPVVEGGEVTRAAARLIVRVTPRTARVKVTGPGGFSSTGGGNWERQDLKPGSYRVVAGARGYVSSGRDVTLTVDDLQTLKLVLERPGALLVTGTPAGARVEVTGPGGFSAVKGFPLSVKGAPGGTYRVKVSRQGYKSVERDAEVRAGATTKVDVKLEKEARASPGGAATGMAGLAWVQIPGGGFRMGSTVGADDEKPVHSVRVGTFYLSRTEVTNAQYTRCVDAGACRAPYWQERNSHYNLKTGTNKEYQGFTGDTQPVVGMSWHDAMKYCKWAGGRLPSEAEWEYAASSGGKGWKYPWGNIEASCRYAVIYDGGDGCGKNRTWPVCSKPAGNSAQGLCDLSGNVSEWVEDCWHGNYQGAPADGSAWIRKCTESMRVMRGGSLVNPTDALLRVIGATDREYSPPGPSTPQLWIPLRQDKKVTLCNLNP